MFKCTICGECCRHISKFIKIWPNQTDGVCNYLEKDLCTIYENRPDFCNFSLAYRYFSDHLTYNEYEETIVYWCEMIKRKSKLL
jgi:Fe-S-cluster containining protein